LTDDPFAFLPEPWPPTDARSMVPPWMLDYMPDATEREAANAYAQHIMGAFNNPKMMKTVRRHFLRETSFLARLAELNPEMFDEVVCAYAERAQLFEQPNAA
jgi:hypothetical protein